MDNEPARPVLQILSGDLWAGKEAQVLAQSAALRERGWDVRVLLFNAAETLTRFRESEIPCDVIDESHGWRKLCAAAREYVAQHRPQIVISNGYKETMLAAMLGSGRRPPWISVFHGAREQGSGIATAKLWVYFQLHRLLSRWRANKIVVVSNALVADLGLRGSNNTVVIRNVVQPASQPATTSPLDTSRPAIVVAGRLAAVKRYDLAIRAFVDVHQQATVKPRLYIVGAGPEETNLRALAEQSGAAADIEFLGFRKDAAALIAAADLLLITSAHEGIPTVVLEAAMAGTAVVTGRLPGILEVFSLLPGYPVVVAEQASVDGYSAAIQSALATKSSAQQQSDFSDLIEKHFFRQGPLSSSKNSLPIFLLRNHSDNRSNIEMRARKSRAVARRTARTAFTRDCHRRYAPSQ